MDIEELQKHLNYFENLFYTCYKIDIENQQKNKKQSKDILNKLDREKDKVRSYLVNRDELYDLIMSPFNIKASEYGKILASIDYFDSDKFVDNLYNTVEILKNEIAKEEK